MSAVKRVEFVSDTISYYHHQLFIYADDDNILGGSRVLVEKPEGWNYLENPGVDGRIILRWIFRKWDVRAWTGLVWLTIGSGGGHV